MKTKSLILSLIASIFTIGSLMANEPVMAPKQISSSVAEMIKDEIYYPEFAIEDKWQGKVVLEVLITEEGDFDVIAANSTNKNLKNYAAQTIEDIDTDDFKDYAGQKVFLSLDYDLELY
jgi:hypothetical protein